MQEIPIRIETKTAKTTPGSSPKSTGDIPSCGPQFAEQLAAHDIVLKRANPTELQMNLGKLCNLACHHCHVDAGPKRTEKLT